eukprot:SAG31_NODE_45114_length_260_cov_0.639752_1_plen_27_part_10
MAVARKFSVHSVNPEVNSRKGPVVVRK